MFLEDSIHAEPSGSLNVPPILLQQMLLSCYAFLYSFISHWFKKALKYVAETRHMKGKNSNVKTILKNCTRKMILKAAKEHDFLSRLLRSDWLGFIGYQYFLKLMFSLSFIKYQWEIFLNKNEVLFKFYF